MVIEWEEITLSSEPVSEIDGNFTNTGNQIHERDEIDFDQVLSQIKQILLPFWDLEFHAEDFLISDLSGNLHLKTDSSLPLPLNTLIDVILVFYERNFRDHPEIPYILTYSLLKTNRLKELIHFLRNYLSGGKIPLDLEIFLIVGGVLSGNLPNIILSGDEKNILNILYKYKYVSISTPEMNFLYDYVVESEENDYLGLVFHLFKSKINGVRSIYPIHERILSIFNSIPVNDKLEFIESFKTTSRYMKIFYLMRTVHTREEIKKFFISEKVKNGKLKSFEGIEFTGYTNLENLNSKIEVLAKSGRFDLLSPFELIECLKEPKMKINIRKSLFDYYSENSNSFSANISLAILYYFDKDYNKFLLYSERGGSLKNKSEFLYIKAICYAEMGYKIPAENLIERLSVIFPDTEELENLRLKMNSITQS